MTRLMPSDPRHAEIDRHQRMMCLLLNPGLHWREVPMAEPELGSVLTDVEDGLAALLDDVPPGAFKEWFDD